MSGDWTDIGVEWALLALRVAFIAALYLFLLQVVRVMLREIRAVAVAREPGPAQPETSAPRVDERGLIVLDAGETWLEPGAYLALGGEIVIGRSVGCDIQLEDGFVSGEHARVVVLHDRTLLYDLESTNGSRVNGEIVDGPVTLFDGDVVQLGRVRFRYAATISGDRPS